MAAHYQQLQCNLTVIIELIEDAIALQLAPLLAHDAKARRILPNDLPPDTIRRTPCLGCRCGVGAKSDFESATLE